MSLHFRCCVILSLFLLPAFVLPSIAQEQPKADAAASAALHQQAFLIPFTPVPGQGAPLITVWINSRLTATFIVDTGTNNCLISQSLVAKLGLKSSLALLDDGKPLLLDGKQTQAVTLTSLKLGGQSGPLNLQPLITPFLVVADQQLRVSADRLVDGMIGANELSEFAVAFDFPGHMLTVCYPGSLTLADAKLFGYGTAGGTILPILASTSLGDFYSVQIGLENKGVSRQVTLLLDTGSQLTAIPRGIAQELSLTALRQLPQAGFSANYSFNVSEARVDALMLGDLRLTGPLVTYGVTSDHVPRLGLDILSGYKVLMDFPAKKMYLQPPASVIKIDAPPSKSETHQNKVQQPENASAP